MTRILKLALAAMFLIAAACGSDDGTTDAAETETDAGSEVAEDEAMEDEAMEDEAMEDEAMEDEAGSEGAEDEAMEDDAMEDDAMEDDAMEDDAMEDDAMEDDAMEDDAMEDDAMEEHGDGLSIVSINFDTAEVVIVNHTDADVDLDGHFMCNFPAYAPIEGVGVVEAGKSVTVTSTVAIPAADGELGLYTADDYNNPDAIVAYVEWGSSGHERSPVAVEAGIWDGEPIVVDGSTLTVG